MTKQKGMVLIASLIILIICSFIAVGIGRFAITSKQDASGHFAQLRGYVDATAAMERAISLVTINSPTITITDADTDPYWWRDAAKWQANGTEFTDYDNNTGTKPKFRIEKRKCAANNEQNGNLAERQGGNYFYRVISRGGDGEQTISMIETYISVPADCSE